MLVWAGMLLWRLFWARQACHGVVILTCCGAGRHLHVWLIFSPATWTGRVIKVEIKEGKQLLAVQFGGSDGPQLAFGARALEVLEEVPQFWCWCAFWKYCPVITIVCVAILSHNCFEAHLQSWNLYSAQEYEFACVQCCNSQPGRKCPGKGSEQWPIKVLASILEWWDIARTVWLELSWAFV